MRTGMLHKMFGLCPYATVQESVDLSGTLSLSTPKFLAFACEGYSIQLMMCSES